MCLITVTNLRTIKRQIADRLQRIGIDRHECFVEAQLIVEHVTGMNAAKLLVCDDLNVSRKWLCAIEDILARRAERVPLQYCLGYTWFMGLRILVAEGVFIPRPDTELLVETAVELIKGKHKQSPVRIGEVGTGSGAIAVSLLKLLSCCRVVACDVLPKAIEAAGRNAMQHGVEARLDLLSGDWRAVLPDGLDAMVSNPPYIPQSQLTSLPPEIILHEPREALLGGDDDGLRFYREFAEFAPSKLTSSGLLLVEVGYNQARAVMNLLEQSGWRDCRSYMDLNKHERVVTALVPEAKLSLRAPDGGQG